jgi:hypothetical protein
MWYDQETQRLTWRAGNDLPALLMAYAGEGNRVPVTLLAAKDFAGNAAQTPQTWQWPITAEAVRVPKPIPELVLPPAPRLFK